MRKLLLGFIVGLAIVISLQIFGGNKQVNLSPIFDSPEDSPAPTSKPGTTFNFENQTYRIHYTIANPANISLSSNFEEKLSARELMEQRSCKALVNGGFYSKEDSALGLLISNGYTESEYQTNTLFNGIFGVTFGDDPFLGTTYPRGSTRVAIQSGPLLVLDQKVQGLQLKNDESARRSVVALTAEPNKVIFLSIYKDGAEYEGPLLADLPQLVHDFLVEEDLGVESAINLDGGSASAFYTDGVSLQELSYIGSYFCIN